ncbi:hypothetical protein D0B32_12110 [Paraburkholderia sp. DHOC27]|nr:hypothetical protein D0B32_12110 [Paraburkholderia sp. DHOC27]
MYSKVETKPVPPASFFDSIAKQTATPCASSHLRARKLALLTGASPLMERSTCFAVPIKQI